MGQGAEASRPLNVDALLARPGRGEVRRFWSAFRVDHPRVNGVGSRVRRTVLRIGAAVGALATFTMVFGIVRALSGGARRPPEQVIGMVTVGVLVVIAFCVLLWAAVRTSGRRLSPRQQWALSRFASDNALLYAPEPVVGGPMPWRQRGRLIVDRAMRSTAPTGRSIEWADYELRRATSASTHTQFGGWIAIGLRRRLPHIVVRATDRARGCCRPRPCPTTRSVCRSRATSIGTSRSTARPATSAMRSTCSHPDVMATAIDDGGGWDIEIVDDVLLLVRPRDVITTDPDEWGRLVRTANAFAGQVEQWERWRDDRVTAVSTAVTGLDPRDTAVARRGRRLRTRWSPATWVWIAFAVLMVATIVAGRYL